MRLLAPVEQIFRELTEIAYMWNEPHRSTAKARRSDRHGAAVARRSRPDRGRRWMIRADRPRGRGR